MADASASTVRLAESVLSIRYDELPAAVVDVTKLLFLDFLAVACGGRALVDSSAPVLEAVQELAGSDAGGATAIGVLRRFAPHYAALLNATFGHSMDFDDNHFPSHGHPGCPVFATVLAIAEARHLSGKALIAAAVAGYEAFGRIGRAHGYAMHGRGFHPTATTGVFGATAAAAHLLGFTPGMLLDGWGIALSQAAGTLQYLKNGAWTKRVHTGLAAHNGVLAATLARHGVVGAADPLEGQHGYFRCYADRPLDLESALQDFGKQFEISATAIKPYPCCRCHHGVIDAVLELVREHGLTAADVESIEVGVPQECIPQVAEPEATRKVLRNVVDAQFSVYFGTAIAFLERRYTWESYARLSDPAVLDVMARTRCVESPVTYAAIRSRRSNVRRDVPYPLGEPENPIGWAPLLDKAEPLLAAALPKQNAEALVGMVRRLEDLPAVPALTALLRG